MTKEEANNQTKQQEQDKQSNVVDDELSKSYLKMRNAIKRMNHRRDAWARRQ